MSIILFKHKNSIIVNKYFIIIFTFSSIRFLLKGGDFFVNEYLIKDTINYFEFLNIISIPCLYLYFKDLIAFKKWNYKQLFHFIPIFLPFLVYIIDLFFVPVPYYIFKFVFSMVLLAYLIYIYLSYKLLSVYVFSRKSDLSIINKQNKLVKNWVILLFTAYVLLFFRLLILCFFDKDKLILESINNYFWLNAAIWLLIYIKILITPELLYGYDLLNEKINEYMNNNIALDNIWILNKNPIITNIKDLKIQEKINANLKKYIFQIENLSFNTDHFKDPEITIDELAKKLNIPTFHLNYIFKYHSSVTFIDYKKIVRIQIAIKLIENNFLNSNTYESLAREVGFKSYMPFYSSFKNIIGLSPQDYFKNLK